MTKSQQMEAIINKSGVNTRRVLVLGRFIHVDTFNKYETKLTDLMTLSGFKALSASDGVHMDGVNGFRMVFSL
jgi:hypothetical protein